MSIDRLTDPLSFGDLLRQHRLEAGLTQEELAERAGISARGVSDLERGARTRPYRHTARTLADALALDGVERGAFLAAARRPVAEGAARSPVALTPLAGGMRYPAAHMPMPPDALVGREEELAAIANLLHDPAIRLVTLTGAGGTGKTRLALEAAARARDDYADGVAFVPLAAITDAALVAPTVARALGARDSAGRTSEEQVFASLRGRNVLLILDNFEQILAAAALVGRMLSACPELTLMVTSRAPLRAAGEHRFPVPPLALPDARHASDPAIVGASEAIRLFVARGRAVEPGFALTAENAADVAAICARLDGLPLAIELAAARLSLLTPAALLGRLEKRLPLLTGGVAGAPARLRTMRDAIAWSYDLLSAEEQALFRRLGVFAGGFTLDAAEAIGYRLSAISQTEDGGWRSEDRTDDPPFPVVHPLSPLSPQHPNTPTPITLDLIGSLVDKSLLRREDEVQGEPRLGMLETVREFALEQLAASGEEEATRRAHLAYFLEMADEQYSMFYLPGEHAEVDQGRSLECLAAEHANVRAALGWALEHDAPAAMRMAGELQWFWLLQGHIGEGLAWLEAALAHPAAQARTADRGMALNSAGFIISQHGLPARAAPFLEEALAIRREVDDAFGVADTLNSLGFMALLQGDYDRAAALLEESIELARDLGHELIVAASLGMLADAVFELGDLERATRLNEESLARARASGDELDIPGVLHGLGLVAKAQGDLERAAELMAEALATNQRLENRANIAFMQQHIGRVELARGNMDRAASLLEESLTLSQEISDRETIVGCCEVLAQIAGPWGRPAEAARLMGAAAAWRHAFGLPLRPSEREEHERAVETARAALGAAAFASAWAAGGALSLEDAVAEALEIAGELADRAN